MLILDDILLSPFRGLYWVFDEIRKAAEQEIHEEADGITLQLQQLYTKLEAGQISVTEFDQREADLLDRLDEIRESGSVLDDDEDDFQEEGA